MALEIALVDASDLVGEGRHRGALVIKASQVQEYDGDVASRFADRVFRRGLGFGIGPAGRDWTILLNAFAGSAGLMDQHRSRIEELLDLEWLERPHEVAAARSDEHTSELQSLMRISYAVFCLKTKNNLQPSSV